MPSLSRSLTFYLQLEAEVAENHHGLDKSYYERLSHYYKSLKSDVGLRPFFRYNWTRRVAPMQEIIASLPNREVPWHIFDAGCGLGTEAIFWSTLRDNIEVTGADISAERLNTAKARRSAYENRLGKSLNLRFLEQDVFSVLKDERFDLVWVMEAISHIDPVEKFLAAVSENLGQDGYLVISDSHVLNPAMAWRVFRLRRKGVALHTHRTTSTGETISYAQEQLFTIGQLSRMLKQTGFSSVKAQPSIFFPPSLARFPWLFSFCTWSDAILNKVPLVRNLGGIYTIVADKQQ
jgi:2-polyprenyl-3-methyl-5-hydroxy-6-metoxy-1,4-benzoquinol methylase